MAVIGIGVSNTPLLRLLLRERHPQSRPVTSGDRAAAGRAGGGAGSRMAAVLRLGEDYLRGLDQDVIFRTPGLRPDVPELLAAAEPGVA
ncbi:MAG: hypothetical protein ACLUNQ_00095 [Oscillospiraceae bacterium]